MNKTISLAVAGLALLALAACGASSSGSGSVTKDSSPVVTSPTPSPAAQDSPESCQEKVSDWASGSAPSELTAVETKISGLATDATAGDLAAVESDAPGLKSATQGMLADLPPACAHKVRVNLRNGGEALIHAADDLTGNPDITMVNLATQELKVADADITMASTALLPYEQ